jgi:outer membrane biosynthesis protein TonB
MRSDYGLYLIAIICFIVAGVFLAGAVPNYSATYFSGMVLITLFAVLGIIFALVGYSVRPKVIMPTRAVPEAPQAAAPTPEPTPPPQPPEAPEHVEEVPTPPPTPTAEIAPEPIPAPTPEEPAKVTEEEKPKEKRVRRRRKKATEAPPT